MKQDRLLVISAHAADYVWRAGGTLAKYVAQGSEVHVVVLSFGARGESNDLWKSQGQTLENVKKIRREETTEAASILGIKNLEFWDFEDYPMAFNEERQSMLLKKIRQLKPGIILTHDKKDIMNPDHNEVSTNVFMAAVMSISNGVTLEGLPSIKQPGIFGFEPHQTELSDYKPEIFIDITDTFDTKVLAMQCFKAQGHLIEYYKQRAIMRGNHARRLSGCDDYKYAESFARYFPVVSDKFV